MPSTVTPGMPYPAARLAGSPPATLQSDLIGKAAFEQDPNGKVAREVGCSGQCRKLSDLKVGKLGSFGQNIQVSARSALYFREFPAEVVGKNFLHAAI